MTILRRAVLVCLLLPAVAFAQSADQEVVSVADAPDPITPGSTLTYTITMTNHGPDPAVNGGFNVNLPGEITYMNTVTPAGFSCFTFGAAVSCINPSWAPSTVVFTMTVQVVPSLINFPDGSFSTTFTTSGTTPDANAANNSKAATTNYDTPQIDLSLTVTDSPDPVFPDGNITYTIPVTNGGPDTATSVNFNVFNSGTLRFQSATAPPGWNCTLPAVNGVPTFTCSNPSFAPSTVNFTVVVQAQDEVLGINDGTVSTVFGVNGTGDDTNDLNNTEQEDTFYTTPDADMTIAVTDSPDPVTPDNDITYTVTIENDGPDTAPNATLNSFNSGTLRFQSAVVPAGWNCTLPSVNAAPTFTCTNPSFANGASSVFTVVARAAMEVLGINDGTVSTVFSASSGVSDPNNANNVETEDTAYVTPDANLGVTATDSPDPVAAGNNITYTGSITSAGPDTATDVTFTANLHASLLFQSLTGPAGFTCGTPAVGANGPISCTIASLANGANLPFTLVAQVNPSLLSGPDGIVQQSFVIGSDTADPTLANNSLTIDTAYTTPDADISVTNADAPDPVAPGGTITYTQTITNNGPDAATNATFSQSTPAGTTFQSFLAAAGWTCATPAAGGTGAVNCTKGAMAVSEVGAFTLVVNVTGGGTISSTVTGDSDTYDSDPPDNTATALTTSIAPTSADLSMSKTTATTNAPAGSTFSYTIVLTNNGPDAATSVEMEDVLPSSLLFRSISAPAGFSCVTPAVGATGTITCTAASLANGASATFTLVVEVAASSGAISNTASGSSATTDPNGGNSSSTSSGVIAGPAQADLELTKTTTSTTATPGGTLNYTITVTNAGPSPATTVVVTDTLPAGLTLISATPSQGTCNASSPVTCNLGTILNGGSATIALSTQVTATSGTITNSASVTSTEGDTDASSAPPIPVGAAAVTPIPTMSEWALMMMAAVLGVLALKKLSS
ncbi:MAG TPA: hypothetical protein VGQ36_15560 [Thermoanaerobaculia bacterium]|jgi:uncharacterized repeat protein (TIGR01451 family)|nr:hypothetical protein [Thermoanaerobaculia bacterium]